MFTPHSPSHGPVPRSPDGPPPDMFTPHSPSHGPVPRSPDGPPPDMFTPHSPSDGPVPRSPDSPPPDMFTPHSPSHGLVPRSPDSPPPDELEDVDELDEATRLLIEQRELAVDLAGGEEAWDALDDEQREQLMHRAEQATKEYSDDEDDNSDFGSFDEPTRSNARATSEFHSKNGDDDFDDD